MTQDPYFVSKDSHPTRKDGLCAMEWTAYLAGEPHTDTPACVSRVLTRFCVALNDRLSDDERQKLRPYLARTIGTRDDGRDPERVRMCQEFVLGTVLPKFLAHDPVALAELEALPTGLALETAERLQDALHAAREISRRSRSRSYERLRKAAGAAGAAWAAGAAGAAWAAEAAWAAWTAGAAEAAEAAFRKRVYDAANARMLGLANELNAEAFALLDRMLPLEPIRLPVVADAEKVIALT